MKTLALLFALSFVALLASAQAPINLKASLALEGYDAVSYRDDKQAVKGDKQFSVQHNGATYHFTSAAHKATFTANPDLYLPAYGGYCAYAVGALDKLVDVNPSTFKVIDGKTYLFHNGAFGNTLPKWNEAEAKLHPQADANWKKITTK